MKTLQLKLRTAVALLCLLAMLASAPSITACGPFTLEAIFAFTVHPEYPLDKYARGELGVVPPTYARSYLYVAYRLFNGTTLTPQQQRDVADLWNERLNSRGPTVEDDSVDQWLRARAKVPGVGPDPKIEVYRNREKPNDFESYLNCQNDEFKTATSTLANRIARFGGDSASVKDWITAQDEVFANCSEGKHIPATPSADAEAIIKSDRAYQIASANFYAGDFVEAGKLYQQISEDKTSPWHKAGPYLHARALVREASLGAPENRTAPLTAAEKELSAILKDRSLNEWHGAAQRLSSIVRLRLHPEERLHELANSLLEPDRSADLKQNLWDYTFLLDQFVDEDTDETKSDAPATLRSDELTDWLLTFQSSKPDSLERALSKFEANRSLPWLVAAVTKIDARNPKVKELLTAAAKVSPDSPAFATVAYHQIRLALEAARYDYARTELDQLLQKERAHLNVSSLNLALSQRMLLAKDLDDLLRYAQRVPAAFSYDDDGREIPEEESDLSNETKAIHGRPLFDADAAKLLNEKLPLELLHQAADSKTLSENLRRDVAQAAWLRAVLLGDMKTADELAPVLKSLVPQLSPLLDEFVAAGPAETKRFVAVYAWLKFPGLEPVVDAGRGRETPLSEQDAYRDNWWCTAAFTESKTEEKPQEATVAPREAAKSVPADLVPFFLTPAQRTAAQQQLMSLKAIGAAPNYLCRQAIQWANKDPGNSRVPEALHLAVKATRYGCTDQNSARWSKAAFDLLHKRFPTSVWAKRTPYWFKD